MKISTSIILILFTSVLFAQTVQEQVAEGIKKYETKYERSAFNLLNPLKNSKYFTAEAMCCLGGMYKNGIYPFSGSSLIYDEEEAMKLFKKAEHKGSVDAIAEIGLMYASGSGVKKNEQKAISYYREAVAKGSKLGELLLANAYQFGDGVSKDYLEALRLYKLSADKNMEYAIFNLANMYGDGLGVEKNIKEAVRLYMINVNRARNEKWATDAWGSKQLLLLGYSDITGLPLTGDEKSKIVGTYKCTGIQELDSFNIIFMQGKIWQGYENENPILNLQKIADNNYDNNIGNAYIAFDGSTRYRAPLWLGADSAYFVKDDKEGFGFKLFLFFAYGKSNTYQTVKNMRSALARNEIATTEGAHPFIYTKGTGENPYLMYRNDNSNDAPYKGLTILVSQTKFLKEKLAKQQAEQESIKRQNENRQNVNAEVKKKGILTFCKYCNGTGSVVDRIITGTTYETTRYKTCTKCGGHGKWME